MWPRGGHGIHRIWNMVVSSFITRIIIPIWVMWTRMWSCKPVRWVARYLTYVFHSNYEGTRYIVVSLYSSSYENTLSLLIESNSSVLHSHYFHSCGSSRFYTLTPSIAKMYTWISLVMASNSFVISYGTINMGGSTLKSPTMAMLQPRSRTVLRSSMRMLRPCMPCPNITSHQGTQR